MFEEQLKQLIAECEPLMSDLRIVRRLDLPDCYIAAGYIRSYVWDVLHGYEHRSRHDDIDVVYFDQQDCSECRDVELRSQLIEETGNERWSIKNQARMHLRNRVMPYISTLDAMSRWPETATAIGARLTACDELELCAPHGLNDLFGMVLRRSPLFADRQYYLARIHEKNWIEDWPLLTLIQD